MADEVPADQDLLDSLPDGVVVADGHGLVTHVNEEARRVLGPEALVGRRLEEVVALQDLQGRDWFALTMPYDGLSTRRRSAEGSWHLPDGTELLVVTRFVRRHPSEPVERVVVSMRSARGRALLDRERSDLVATVAHELRSPLTGVRGFTATLLERWDRFSDDQKKLIMRTVHNDTDRLTRLIADLLEVARIDTGRLSLLPRRFDVVEELEHIRESVSHGTGREIVLDAGPRVPEVFADPDRFSQVMTNIVDNAVRHGEGTVRITAVPSQHAGRDLVAVTVEDAGSGISPEIRTRVFTKFWKHGTRGGTGLGMYIAHGLVTAHGGTIAIGESTHGGARVEVGWPTGPVLDDHLVAN